MTSYEDGRVLVRPGLVEVDGRAFVVGPLTRVEAIADPPQFMKAWLALLGLSLLGVPATVVYVALRPELSWLLIVPAITAAVSIIRVITASTRYHLALVEGEARLVYSSADLQTIAFLVAMVRDAIPDRRQGAPPSW